MDTHTHRTTTVTLAPKVNYAHTAHHSNAIIRQFGNSSRLSLDPSRYLRVGSATPIKREGAFSAHACSESLRINNKRRSLTAGIALILQGGQK